MFCLGVALDVILLTLGSLQLIAEGFRDPAEKDDVNRNPALRAGIALAVALLIWSLVR